MESGKKTKTQNTMNKRVKKKNETSTVHSSSTYKPHNLHPMKHLSHKNLKTT